MYTRLCVYARAIVCVCVCVCLVVSRAEMKRKELGEGSVGGAAAEVALACHAPWHGWYLARDSCRGCSIEEISSFAPRHLYPPPLLSELNQRPHVAFRGSPGFHGEIRRAPSVSPSVMS